MRISIRAKELVAEFCCSVELHKAGEKYDLGVDVIASKLWNGTRYIANKLERIKLVSSRSWMRFAPARVRRI